MVSYREGLPQLEGTIFLTDGGLETDLCFNKNIDLPEFAAYDLLRTEEGQQTLLDYFQEYVEIAKRHRLGLVLETPTWRANRDWGDRLGDSPAELDRLNRAAVELLELLRTRVAGNEVTVVISGCCGPRGDGYKPERLMSADEARDYHAIQMASFANTRVDMVSALTLNYIEEAIGFANAAAEHQLPVCVSFTVETDGRLPGGESLEEAIVAVDDATAGTPAYYMVNCAHSTHFDHYFANGGDWLDRVRGLRCNASRLSHEELDNSETLDDGDPEAFGLELNVLRELAPHLTVLGGCCGTDHRHIDHLGCRVTAEGRPA